MTERSRSHALVAIIGYWLLAIGYWLLAKIKIDKLQTSDIQQLTAKG